MHWTLYWLGHADKKSLGMQSLCLCTLNIKYLCSVWVIQDKGQLPQSSHLRNILLCAVSNLASRKGDYPMYIHFIHLMKSGLHFSMAPRRSAFRTTTLNSVSCLSSAPTERFKGLSTELTESPQRLHIKKHLIRVIHLLIRKSKIKLRMWIRKVTLWIEVFIMLAFCSQIIFLLLPWSNNNKKCEGHHN